MLAFEEIYYEVKRRAGSVMSGCRGQASYYKVGGDNIGYVGAHPEDILGMPLGDGSVIKVTVEVIKHAPMPVHCINPWGEHAESLRQHKSKEGRKVQQNCVEYRG